MQGSGGDLPRAATQQRSRPWWSAPSGMFPWGYTLVFVVLLLHPLALEPLLVGHVTDPDQVIADMCRLLENIALLGAGVVLAYEWRLSHNAATGWLSVMLAMTSTQTLPISLLALAGALDGGFGKVNGFTTLPIRLLMIGVLVYVIRTRKGPPTNPMLIGIPLGVLVAVARTTTLAGQPDPSHLLGEHGDLVFALAVVVLTVGFLVAVWRLPGLPRWARFRFVTAYGLLVAGASFPSDATYETPSVVSIAAGALGTALLLATSIALGRATFRAHSAWLIAVAHRVARADDDERNRRDRMHELTATVAGVAHASRLLSQEDAPTGERRRRLRDLLDAEMARLERLQSAHFARVEPFALDEVVSPAVDFQRALGHDVRWMPSGRYVVADPDDVADVLHILLANAARHAPGAVTTVSSRLVNDQVEVLVADDGPGIDPAVRPRLFERGARRPESPGQGIGLELARRLMREQGGDVRLADPAARGATFVVSMPADRDVAARAGH
jgi:signal transduction histidine kinase